MNCRTPVSSLSSILATLALLIAGCTDAAQPVRPSNEGVTDLGDGPSALDPGGPPGGDSDTGTSGAASGEMYLAVSGVYDRGGLDSFGFGSRYVLSEDGRFELQYFKDQWGSFAYKGEYSFPESRPSLIALDFDDYHWFNPDGWARLDDSGLHVSYKEEMSLSDFEGGVYVANP